MTPRKRGTGRARCLATHMSRRDAAGPEARHEGGLICMESSGEDISPGGDGRLPPPRSPARRAGADAYGGVPSAVARTMASKRRNGAMSSAERRATKPER